MHMLARNFAIQLKETMELSIDSEYETPLNFNKVFFGLKDDRRICQWYIHEVHKQ